MRPRDNTTPILRGSSVEGELMGPAYSMAADFDLAVSFVFNGTEHPFPVTSELD